MVAKRIIPCLDVKNEQVVKGVGFKNHKIVGDILVLAERYCDAGADELVFYDITASCEDRVLDYRWVTKIADFLSIPFCVAGGIRNLKQAETVFLSGADKISINSPALERPVFINELATQFGTQSIVVGIDSKRVGEDYWVYQYTGAEITTLKTARKTSDWLREVEDRGAGEIVLNCMDQDGKRMGYDIEQLNQLQRCTGLPIVASGGAGSLHDFLALFTQTRATGALAASVFHHGILELPTLKTFLTQHNIEVRHVV